MIAYVDLNGDVVKGEIWCPGPLKRTVWVLDPGAKGGAVVVRLDSRRAPAKEVHYAVVDLPPTNATVSREQYEDAKAVLALREEWEGYRLQDLRNARGREAHGSYYHHDSRVKFPETPDPTNAQVQEAARAIATADTELWATNNIRAHSHNACENSIADRTFKSLTFKHATVS